MSKTEIDRINRMDRKKRFDSITYWFIESMSQ